MITKETLETSYLSTLTNGIAGTTDDDHRSLEDAVNEQSFLSFEGLIFRNWELIFNRMFPLLGSTLSLPSS